MDKSQLTTLDKNVGSEYKPNENFSNIQTDINNEEHSTTNDIENYESNGYYNKSTNDSSCENDIKEVDLTDTETVSDGKVIKSPEPLDFKVNSPVFNFGDYVNNNTLKDSTKNLVQDKINECDNNFKVIGTLFDTYILIEKDKNLLLIDQHAGHERILFDKFCK